MKGDTIGGTRQVVPLWREVTKQKVAEAEPLRPSAPATAAQVTLFEHHYRLRQEEPSLVNAVDVLDAALFVTSRYKAWGPAKQILANERSLPRSLIAHARAILDRTARPIPALLARDPAIRRGELASTVRNLRRSVREYPRDVLTWLDLARAQASLGSNAAAEAAVRVALGLEPNNRVVLRSAARFYMHAGEYDRAHALLATTSRRLRDPWLAASEIALAPLAQRTSQSIRVGRELVDGGSFAPLHVSELAASLGTFFLQEGNSRLARRYFEVAALSPNATSEAQLVWASRSIKDIQPSVHAGFSEAAMRWNVFHGHLDAALDECWRWLNDEPYSSGPAANGSFFATVFDRDYLAGLAFAKTGLVANPGDPILSNNAAVALACLGSTEEATRMVASVSHRADPGLAATIAATRGLIHFREGESIRGRREYRRALLTAVENKDRKLAFRAFMHWMHEEARVGHIDAGAARQIAQVGDRVIARNPQIGWMDAEIWKHKSASIADLAASVGQDIPFFDSEFLLEVLRVISRRLEDEVSS